jgi:hypothetical protein
MEESAEHCQIICQLSQECEGFTWFTPNYPSTSSWLEALYKLFFWERSSIGGLGHIFWKSLMHCLAERPPKNLRNIFELLLIHLWFFINDFYIFRIFLVWGASPGSAGCYKNATETPMLDIAFLGNVLKIKILGNFLKFFLKFFKLMKLFISVDVLRNTCWLKKDITGKVSKLETISGPKECDYSSTTKITTAYEQGTIIFSFTN